MLALDAIGPTARKELIAFAKHGTKISPDTRNKAKRHGLLGGNDKFDASIKAILESLNLQTAVALASSPGLFFMYLLRHFTLPTT